MVAALLVVCTPIVIGGFLTIVMREVSRPWFLTLVASASGVPLVTVTVALAAMLGREDSAAMLAVTPWQIILGLIGGILATIVYWVVLA